MRGAFRWLSSVGDSVLDLAESIGEQLSRFLPKPAKRTEDVPLWQRDDLDPPVTRHTMLEAEGLSRIHRGSCGPLSMFFADIEHRRYALGGPPRLRDPGQPIPVIYGELILRKRSSWGSSEDGWLWFEEPEFPKNETEPL